MRWPPRYPGVPVEHLPGRILAPGFLDLHIHYPQTDVIGSPAEGLLPWLEHYTFPHEARFSDAAYAADVATFFLDELSRNGVTTALTFATSHPTSVNALFTEAQQRGLRLITGKVLQDRHSPDGVRDETEQSLIDTEALIQQLARRGPAGLRHHAALCARAAAKRSCAAPASWRRATPMSGSSPMCQRISMKCAGRASCFQRHARTSRSMTTIGLMRERAIYAHCIHFDDDDRALMRDTGTAAAVSPTSNLFLGSGFFDYAGADRVGFRYGLASDVGGGTSFSPFHTMLAAYYRRARPRRPQTKPGLSLSPQHLWWQHTAGAARALGLQGVVGNLQPGCEADFIVLNPAATPLLARRTAQAQSLDELLFAMIVLGDDRLVEKTVISG